jgi:hypothetical protein
MLLRLKIMGTRVAAESIKKLSASLNLPKHFHPKLQRRSLYSLDRADLMSLPAFHDGDADRLSLR